MKIENASRFAAIWFLGVFCASAAGIRLMEDSASTPAGPQSKVFARVVSGGGWDTLVVITNLGPTPVLFQQLFLGSNGKASSFTLDFQDGNTALTTSAIQGSVAPNASRSFILRDAGEGVREGWSILAFDASQGRLGGYATIRHRNPKGDLTEATVPLSGMQDVSVRLPFDNTGGSHSQLTVVNPASNLPAEVSLTYFDAQGEVILLDWLPVQPGGQVTIDVPNTYPDLANKLGTIAVEANINRLSVAGIRYSSSSGALSALPMLISDGSSNLQ